MAYYCVFMADFSKILSQAAFAYIRLKGAPYRFVSRLLGLEYQIIIPANTYAPWLKDEDFNRTFDSVQGNTLVNRYQAWELWQAPAATRSIPGDILEVGVWRGSSSILMGTRLKKENIGKTIYACDTFEGVVKTGTEDNYYKGGEHSDTSLDFVRSLVNTKAGLSNVELLKGIFPDDTGHLLADKSFSLCHIDVDAYPSGKDVLDWVWPRLSIGGMVIFNDYGFPLTRGITRLVNEQLGLPDRMVIHNLNGNGIIVKVR